MFNNISFSIIALILLISLGWGLGYNELLWMKFFNPRKENVRRQVFENTKSYTHGVIQDLGKYYEEYQKAENKTAIQAVIKMRFAEFDANKINSLSLKQFLISTRGY